MMDVAAWRREKRLELYAARKAMTAEQRHNAARKIAGELDDHCARHKRTLIGLYSPIKHEPSLLSWARLRAQSLQFCLPVVVARGQPLEYWRWTLGDALQSGVWGVNRHANGTPYRRPKGTPFSAVHSRSLRFLCLAEQDRFFVPA
jgi:5-formyltetrahydrofolate cyclo-ligase